MNEEDGIGWALTQLLPQQERAFQFAMRYGPGWRDMNRELGGWFSPDNPMYDYRGAWLSGQMPERNPEDRNRYHGFDVANPLPPSREGKALKAPANPERWWTEMERLYGPWDQWSPQTLAEALMRMAPPGDPRSRWQ